MSSNAHHNPIIPYCSQPTQTQDDDSEADSDFPPCLEGNCTPIMSRSSPAAVPSRYHCKPTVLYCSRLTQTRDDYEADSEESDFPPCLEGKYTPIMSRSSPAAVPSRYHHKPIVLYCSRPTQTRDDSKADSEESDFPPCLEGNCTPIMSRSSPTVPSHYLPAATSGSQQQLTTSGGKEPQSQHRRLPNPGLGQTNVVNTLATATALNTKVVILYIS
jgi:hypothetical protein